MSAYNKEDDNKRVPLSVPFSVAKAGSEVSIDFVIEQKKFYAVTLSYHFDEKTAVIDAVYGTLLEDLKKISAGGMGGAWCSFGNPCRNFSYGKRI